MVLQFNPPDWLIQQYLQQPRPLDKLSNTLGDISTYLQTRRKEQEQKQLQQKQLTSLDQMRKANEFKSVADYIPEDQIPTVAQGYGINLPAAAPSSSQQQPNSATPLEQQAQQSLPSEHPTAGGSPIIDHWNATMSGNSQAPSGQPGMAGSQPPMPPGKPTSRAGLKRYHEGLANQKLERDLATDPNAPVPVLSKEAALAAGSVNPHAKIVEPSDISGERDARREERMAKAVTDYGHQIETHPVIKKLNDQQIGVDQVEELAHLVQSGNTVASSAMGTKMAKAMGEVGVLTETDIRRYVQSGKLTQGAADTLSKWTTGKPTDATMSEIQQISDTLKDSFAEKVQPIYNRHIDRFSRAYKISPEEASHLLAIPYRAASPAAQGGAYSDSGKEARYQAWKAKQAKP